MTEGNGAFTAQIAALGLNGQTPTVLARLECMNRRMAEREVLAALSEDGLLPLNYFLCLHCGGAQFVFPENGVTDPEGYATDKETPAMCENCNVLFGTGVL